MGNFFRAAHLRCRDAVAARAVIEQAAGELKFRCWLAPVAGEWVTFFPNDQAALAAIGRFITQRIETVLLTTVVHDSDVFCFAFYRAGVEEFEFANRPEYFRSAPEAARVRANGDPRDLAPWVAPPHGAGDLASWFARRRELDPETLLEQFMELLAIHPAATSYDYLEAGERHAVSRWAEFMHVPDLAAEKAAARAESARIAAVKQDLLRQRILIFDSTLRRGRSAWRQVNLHGAHPAGGFVCSGYEGTHRLQWWQPPQPPAPLPFAPQDLQLPLRCRLLADARRLAVVTERGSVVVDLVSGAERPIAVAASDVMLAIDDAARTTCLVERNGFTVASIDDPRQRTTFPIAGDAKRWLAHPREPHLLWHAERDFGLVDRRNGHEIARSQWLHPGLRAKKAAQWRAKGHDPEEIFDLERDSILSWALTPDGDFLLTGTTEGLRVYRYADLLRAGSSTVAPVFAFETCVELQDLRFVNALVFDPTRRVVIFSRGDDSLLGLSLSSGQTCELQPTLDHARLSTLALSGNQLVGRRRGYMNIRRREDEDSYQVWDAAGLLAGFA